MRILRAIGSLIWNLVFLIFMYWVWSTGTLVGYLFFGLWCCGLLISAIELIFDIELGNHNDKRPALSQESRSNEDDENSLSEINPASGLPMIGQWDIHGNTFGSSSSSDRHW